MTLRDSDSKRRKQVIANFAAESECPNVIKAITSTVSTNSAKILGLRELIVYLRDDAVQLKEEEVVNGYISYQHFLLLPDAVLRQEDRLYLADRSQCTLSYPNTTDLKLVYFRQNKARNFNGTYHVFIKNAYDATGHSLLKIILNIDTLAHVTLHIQYPADHRVYFYEGSSEFYNHNLKAEVQSQALHTSEQKNIVLLFDNIKESRMLPEAYTGLLLDTDDENNARSFSFIAIKQHLPDSTLPEAIGIQNLQKKPAQHEFVHSLHQPFIISFTEFEKIKNAYASLKQKDPAIFFWSNQCWTNL
jgi:hypothetical protein